MSTTHEIRRNDGTVLQAVTGTGTAVMARNAHQAWNPDEKIVVVGIGFPAGTPQPKPQDFIDVLRDAVAESGHADSEGNYNEPDEPESDVDTDFVQQAQPELDEVLDDPTESIDFASWSITDLRKKASQLGLKGAYKGFTKPELVEYIQRNFL